jgi:calcyphosin
MKVAGSGSWNTSQTKGVKVMGDMAERKLKAAMQSKGSFAYTSDEELLNRVRERIRERGARGILGLGRSFGIMDDDRSGTLDRKEFSKALSSYRISTDPKEHEAIFDLLDPNHDGQIDYNEFLRAMMGEMNSRRQSLVLRAFKILDKDGSGELDITDIKQTYNAKKHPDVM